MEAFVERIIEEQRNLEEKIDKLFRFVHSDVYKKLSEENQVLLDLQYMSMVSYNNILIRRIKINKEI